MPVIEKNETKTNEVVEKPQEQTPPPAKKTVEDFIQAVEENKDKTVSIEEYNKAIEERNKAMSYIMNGEKMELEASKAKEVDIAELKKVFSDPNASNLDVAKASIELRDAIIEKGEHDPFLPNNPTDQDIASAQKVYDTFKECIEEANGDDNTFRYLLEQRIQKDDPALIANLKKRQKSMKTY